jgi:lycopene cyclase domain-containing protein
VTYTAATAIGMAAAAVLDLVVLRTRLLAGRVFWISYAIALGFQLLANGVLTGRGVVRYDRHAILGLRIAHAPVEDVGFGFALILATLALWVRLTGGGAGDGGGRTRSRRGTRRR